MAMIHISEAEAARDLPSLLAQVRDGAEVVIESGNTPIAILKPASEPRGRLISEAIARAKKFEEDLGFAPVMEDDFAADMEEIIRNRKPRQSAWD